MKSQGQVKDVPIMKHFNVAIDSDDMCGPENMSSQHTLGMPGNGGMRGANSDKEQGDEAGKE